MARFSPCVVLLCLAPVIAGQVRPTVSGFSADAVDVRGRLTQLKLDSFDISALPARGAEVREIVTSNNRELGGVGAVVACASPNAFIDSYSSFEALRRSQHIIEIGRFGKTPAISDLAGLTIDNGDLYALWKSAPGDSQIKLSEKEILAIRESVKGSDRLTPLVKEHLAAEYKKMLLRRVTDYTINGTLEGTGYADKEDRVNAEQAFIRLAREQAQTPGLCRHLSELWNGPMPWEVAQCQTFCYWAKERFGELKSVINLIQVTIHREGSRTFIISKQIYSSHYTEAGLSVAEFIPFSDDSGRERTLVIYTIRMELDMLGGTLGFLKKRMAEPRILVTLKESLSGLRLNIENTSIKDSMRADLQPGTHP